MGTYTQSDVDGFVRKIVGDPDVNLLTTARMTALTQDAYRELILRYKLTDSNEADEVNGSGTNTPPTLPTSIPNVWDEVIVYKTASAAAANLRMWDDSVKLAQFAQLKEDMAAKTLLRFAEKGETWASGTYTLGAVVSHNGATYVCVVASTGATPGASSDWSARTGSGYTTDDIISHVRLLVGAPEIYQLPDSRISQIITDAYTIIANKYNLDAMTSPPALPSTVPAIWNEPLVYKVAAMAAANIKDLDGSAKLEQLYILKEQEAVKSQMKSDFSDVWTGAGFVSFVRSVVGVKNPEVYNLPTAHLLALVQDAYTETTVKYDIPSLMSKVSYETVPGSADFNPCISPSTDSIFKQDLVQKVHSVYNATMGRELLRIDRHDYDYLNTASAMWLGEPYAYCETYDAAQPDGSRTLLLYPTPNIQYLLVVYFQRDDGASITLNTGPNVPSIWKEPIIYRCAGMVANNLGAWDDAAKFDAVADAKEAVAAKTLPKASEYYYDVGLSDVYSVYP
jgi:hypothetical protein